jgi:hypothetical protein
VKKAPSNKGLKRTSAARATRSPLNPVLGGPDAQGRKKG